MDRRTKKKKKVFPKLQKAISRLEKYDKILSGIVIASIILLWVVKIWVTAVLTIKNAEYVAALTQIDEIRRENSILHAQLLQTEALTNIEPEATKQGFVPARYVFVR